jgi:hypothetical protein
MNRKPLTKVLLGDGAMLGWVSLGEPLLADVMRRYAAAEAAAERHRRAVRDGKIAPVRDTRWDISDRN